VCSTRALTCSKVHVHCEFFWCFDVRICKSPVLYCLLAHLDHRQPNTSWECAQRRPMSFCLFGITIEGRLHSAPCKFPFQLCIHSAPEVDDTSAGKKRVTTPYMTKFERARVLGTRALQVRSACRAPSLLSPYLPPPPPHPTPRLPPPSLSNEFVSLSTRPQHSLEFDP
jgi:hypothetical protein